MTFLGKICVTMRKYQKAREFKKKKEISQTKRLKNPVFPPSMPKSLK
jgi:hypothetical protein